VNVDVRKGRCPTSGGELTYREAGEGPPVVLLHGFPLSSSMWRDLAPLLAQRSRVVAIDLLGYGDADQPIEASLDVAAQAGYVGESLERLGIERFAVVGHAEGGGIAQLLALEDRGVDAMVLLAPICFDAWPAGPIRTLQHRDPDRLSPELAEGVLRDLLLAGVGPGATIDEDLVERSLRPWRRPGGTAALVRAARALDGVGLTGHEDAFAAWELPVLLLWGEDDPFLPPALGERLMEAMPSSSLGLLPGVGHLLTDEAGDAIGPMISEWLRVRYLRQPHSHGATDGLVTLELGRRPPWHDLAEAEREDGPVRYDPDQQEVGPNA
jgi:2-hydroxymuconate-semialdehyde hydrolase